MSTLDTKKQTLTLAWNFWRDYSSANVQQYAPLSAGVYVLATKLTNGNLRIFYVGQTDNLDRRLKEHLAASENNEGIKNNVSKFLCAFRYAEVAAQSDRDKAERALYYKFTPSCNDEGAILDVEDVNINF